MTTAQTLSISINRPADAVYNFMRDINKLPAWAAGLCLSIVKSTGENTWLIHTPTGEATVRLTEQNKFRIMDHYVQIGYDPEIYIPIRVLENGEGSEILFTLFRLPGMTDERYEQDRQAVQKDLDTLKKLLESSGQ